MQPSGECLRRIAPTAAMVNEFIETTQNTNKKLFLANSPTVDRSLDVCENFVTLYSRHRCDKLRLNAKRQDKAEELANISSYQTL